MYNPYGPPGGGGKPKKIEVNFKRNRVSAKKSGMGTVNAGGAVVIIIFVVLCLTIFGLLSFATSFADKKLADKNLANVAHYYSADSAAEEKLARVYGAIRSGLDGASLDRSVRLAAEAMPFEIKAGDYSGDLAGENGENSENMEAAAVFYRTETDPEAPAGAKVKFYLNSAVVFYHNKNTGQLTYEIFEWRVTMESDFDYDDRRIDVWTGNFD